MFQHSQDAPVEYYAVRRTPLIMHPGVLEIVLVLRGSLEVVVSCERFILQEGDYAVLNEGDPHYFTGSKDNITASIQVRLRDFAYKVPAIDGVIFACESFDLPRFKNAEESLRRQIVQTLLTEPEIRNSAIADLLSTLADNYAFEDYYQRRKALTPNRRLQFRQLVVAMDEHLESRDILERVAAAKHYSKGSLSRIVREATAVSFTDLLTWLRVSKAERALLNSDSTVAQISAECGFSDVKYFTRDFRAWFGASPADYRKRMLPLLKDAGSVITKHELGRTLAQKYLTRNEMTFAPPRLSLTPLLVKNLGGRADLFRTIAELARSTTPPMIPEIPRVPHLLPIRVTADGGTPLEWVDIVRGVDLTRFTPVVILPALNEALSRQVVGTISQAGVNQVNYWLSYEGGHEHAAERLSIALLREFDVSAIPMRIA